MKMYTWKNFDPIYTGNKFSNNVFNLKTFFII